MGTLSPLERGDLRTGDVIEEQERVWVCGEDLGVGKEAITWAIPDACRPQAEASLHAPFARVSSHDGPTSLD